MSVQWEGFCSLPPDGAAPSLELGVSEPTIIKRRRIVES
jgi:hypothetical protein